MPKPKGLKTITAQMRAQDPQFSSDFYVDGDKLFCSFCQHTVDWQRKDTLVDHMKSAKHVKNKDTSKGKPPKKKQCTLFGKASTSMEQRCEFQRDFVRMMTYADIPLEKTTKMKPFMKKHCPQGGSLTTPENLRQTHVPRVFDEHYSALKEKLADKLVSVMVDEMTDWRDNKVLNVVVGHLENLYLVDCVFNFFFMEKCNAQTVSQAVIKSLTNVGIDYNNVCIFATDNAAYCKAAFQILKNIMPNAKHVGCMAHILNLVGEVLVKDEYFNDVDEFVNDIKNIFKRQPDRQKRYKSHLRDRDIAPNLPPEPVKTRWGTWFKAVEYHRTRLNEYESFFNTESSEAQNMQRARRALAENKQSFLLKMNFISESTPKITHNLTKLEGNKPFAAVIYEQVNDISTYLSKGATKRSNFGEKTDESLELLEME